MIANSVTETRNMTPIATAPVPPPQVTTPVLFLNPDIVLDRTDKFEVGVIPFTSAVGGSLSLRNEAMEAVNALAERIGAVLVCTTERQPYDVRELLLSAGARLQNAPDWESFRSGADRAAAIEKWWRAHGEPRAVIMDRPGIHVPGTISVSVAERGTLTMPAVDRVLAMLTPAAGKVARHA